MPTAWAPIVTRVWSSVRSAIFRPSPGSPTSRSAGMPAVVEVQLAGRAALDAELALRLAEGEALVALLHARTRVMFAAARAVGVGDREHRVVLADARRW